MKSQTMRLRRALYLVPYVLKFGDKGILLSELAATVGIAPAVLEKELRALLNVSVPESCDVVSTDSVRIYIDGKGKNARVSAMPCRLLQRPPRLTTQEALALLIGAEAVKATGIGPFDEAIGRAAAKIRGVLRRQDEAESEDESCGPDPIDPSSVVLAVSGSERRATVAALSRACRERRVVELDYASVSSQSRKPIRVEPYGLLNHRGSWYVLGNSLTHLTPDRRPASPDGGDRGGSKGPSPGPSFGKNRIFIFKVERVLGVKVLDQNFAAPKDFDVRKYQGKCMFITDWKPTRVTLRLGAAASERLCGRMPEGKRGRDGSSIVTFKDHITGWLAAWILRQGEGVEVVEPAELREWVAKLATRVAEAHGRQPTDTASESG